MKERRNALLLIRLQDVPAQRQHHHAEKDDGQCVFPLDACQKRSHNQHGQKHQGRAQVRLKKNQAERHSAKNPGFQRSARESRSVRTSLKKRANTTIIINLTSSDTCKNCPKRAIQRLAPNRLFPTASTAISATMPTR